MSDSWSLKDKRKWIFASEKWGDPTLDIEDDDENNFEDTWIHIKDIDLLRQKLIEDIDNIIIESLSYFEDSWKIEEEARNKAEKAINKRFGVDSQ